MKADGRFQFDTEVEGITKAGHWETDEFGDSVYKFKHAQVQFGQTEDQMQGTPVTVADYYGTLFVPLTHTKHLRVGGKIRVTIEVIE
jgi:hypothetical protein